MAPGAGARDDGGDGGDVALRTELIEGIRRHRPQFEDAGERSERMRALPADAARTLRRMGIFWLKTPGELGGTPLRVSVRLPHPKAVPGAIVAVHSIVPAALTRPRAQRNSAHIGAQTQLASYRRGGPRCQKTLRSRST